MMFDVLFELLAFTNAYGLTKRYLLKDVIFLPPFESHTSEAQA